MSDHLPNPGADGLMWPPHYVRQALHQHAGFSDGGNYKESTGCCVEGIWTSSRPVVYINQFISPVPEDLVILLIFV